MKLYFFLGCFLAFLWNLAPTYVDSLREKSISLLLFAWPGKNLLKRYLDDRPWNVSHPQTGAISTEDPLEEKRRLTKLETIYEWLLSEEHIQQELALLKECKGPEEQTALQDKWQHLTSRLRDELLALPGDVIQRDPSSWASSLWVHVGHFDNRSLGKEIISKNSPVLAQGALVGIIEYVGERQSRVRLLTDGGFVPAVRAIRGGLQNQELATFLQATITRLFLRDDLFTSQEKKETLLSELQHLFHTLGGKKMQENLAKGELHGSSSALWRVRGPLLKGIGFNYDFPDAEGPARDLRTGRPLGATEGAWTPLIQQGDLLVTSGLDGLFPPNLPVALVERVLPTREGAHSYEIEAIPAANKLNDLRTVWILPALE